MAKKNGFWDYASVLGETLGTVIGGVYGGPAGAYLGGKMGKNAVGDSRNALNFDLELSSSEDTKKGIKDLSANTNWVTELFADTRKAQTTPDYFRYVDAADKITDNYKGKQKRPPKKDSTIKAIETAGDAAALYYNVKDKQAVKSDLKNRKEFADNMAAVDLAADEVNIWADEKDKQLEGVFSDEKLKKHIEGGEGKLDDFLGKLKAYQYEYKEPEKHGEGNFISPMAQDLEKSELGSEMVRDSSEGKMVNYQRGLGTIVAALAHLDKKISELEASKKGNK